MDDVKIRSAAFVELKRRVQIHGQCLPWAEIIKTFRIGDEEVFLANRARGIFKPRQMARGVLSVKSTLPRVGRDRRYYDDRRSDDTLLYAFQGTDPNLPDNRRLKEAFEDQTPFIYFHGVTSARYEALWPAYISKWLPDRLKAEIQIGFTISSDPYLSIVKEDERRYYTHLAKQRIHQSTFREMVLDAYGNRCALSGLPIRILLYAAHIYPDGHDQGLPIINNGISMSKLHHAAFDGNLIGINPDGRIAISERILSQKDGPLLEDGLKALRGKKIQLPSDPVMRPNRDALAFRFEEFLSCS